MRKFLVSGAAIALCAIAVAAGAPASAATPAATGRVIVFSTEFQELDVWENPDERCRKLPLAAHVLVNQTDRPVHTYSDPFCIAPSLTMQPGYGGHVAAGTGSFSVGA